MTDDMKLPLIFASGETMLHGFVALLVFVGIIGSGISLQGAGNPRRVGTMILIAGIALVFASIVYFAWHPDSRPF